MDNSNIAVYIYMVIEAVVFCIPIATLIWNASKMAAKIEKNESDIADLKSQMDIKVDKLISDVNDMKIMLAEIRTEQKMMQKKEEGTR